MAPSPQSVSGRGAGGLCLLGGSHFLAEHTDIGVIRPPRLSAFSYPPSSAGATSVAHSGKASHSATALASIFRSCHIENVYSHIATAASLLPSSVASRTGFKSLMLCTGISPWLILRYEVSILPKRAFFSMLKFHSHRFLSTHQSCSGRHYAPNPGSPLAFASQAERFRMAEDELLLKMPRRRGAWAQ